MASGRNKSEWARTASIMALTANINRDPKKTNPFRPEDFIPGEWKKKTVQPAPFIALKQLCAGLVQNKRQRV